MVNNLVHIFGVSEY